MISNITSAAESVGITAVVSNSSEKIEVQLNRLTGQEDLPILLVSWDMQINVEFDQNGFYRNPSVSVTCLLMDKPEDTTKDEHEQTSEQMFYLYLDFIKALSQELRPNYLNYSGEPVSSVTAGLLPMYGHGKHSGVVGNFNMAIAVDNCED